MSYSSQMTTNWLVCGKNMLAHEPSRTGSQHAHKLHRWVLDRFEKCQKNPQPLKNTDRRFVECDRCRQPYSRARIGRSAATDARSALANACAVTQRASAIGVECGKPTANDRRCWVRLCARCEAIKNPNAFLKLFRFLSFEKRFSASNFAVKTCHLMFYVQRSIVWVGRVEARAAFGRSRVERSGCCADVQQRERFAGARLD